MEQKKLELQCDSVLCGGFKPMWMYPEQQQAACLPARWGHSGCYSAGKLYVYGGCCGGLHFGGVAVLDLQTMGWMPLTTTGQQPAVCDSHSAVLQGRKMTVFGGTDGVSKSNDVCVLDLDSLVWSRPQLRGTAPAPRESHTATIIDDKRMLVFGGSGEGDGRYLGDVFVLDLERMEWTRPVTKGDPPAPRDSHTAVVMGKLLVIYGGDCGDRYLGDVDVLELETFTWSKVAVTGAVPGARAGHVATVHGTTKMLVFGGVGDRTYYNDLWVLDISNRTWVQPNVENKPQGRFSHVGVLSGNDLFICGEDERPLSELLVLHLSKEREVQHKLLGNRNNTRSVQAAGPASKQGKGGLIRGGLPAGACFPQAKRRRADTSPQAAEGGAKGFLKLPRSQSSEQCVQLHILPQQQQQQQGSPPMISHQPAVFTPDLDMVGSQLQGTVDGVFDAGYLVTAHLNGQVFRGVLFCPEEGRADEEDVRNAGASPSYHRTLAAAASAYAHHRRQPGWGCYMFLPHHNGRAVVNNASNSNSREDEEGGVTLSLKLGV